MGWGWGHPRRVLPTAIRASRRTASIRHLEALAKIERAWLGIDAAIVDGEGRVLAPLQCKSAPDAVPANTVATGPDPSPADPLSRRSDRGRSDRQGVRVPLRPSSIPTARKPSSAVRRTTERHPL